MIKPIPVEEEKLNFSEFPLVSVLKKFSPDVTIKRRDNDTAFYLKLPETSPFLHREDYKEILDRSVCVMNPNSIVEAICHELHVIKGFNNIDVSGYDVYYIHSDVVVFLYRSYVQQKKYKSVNMQKRRI